METRCLQLEKALLELGDSPDAIVRLMQAKHLQGVRNTVRFLNPIVRLLSSSLGLREADLDLIERGTLRVRLTAGDRVYLPLPRAVGEFLDRFNSGAYPDLEMSSENGINSR